jgi:hypothetical protein
MVKLGLVATLFRVRVSNFSNKPKKRKISLIGENEGKPDLLVRQVVTLFRAATQEQVVLKDSQLIFLL